MAIIEPVPVDVPLSQGDVLNGVRLFHTRNISADDGGEPHGTSTQLCLVLSRPCVVAHKPMLLVAAIDRFPDSVPRAVDSFEEVLAFLNELRDGVEAPDLFYLGQLPTFEGRFAARLDSLHTIGVPRDQEALRQVLARKRLGRLHVDFARDLHVRLFRAFASLGFDDHGWMSTSDLRWLVSKGQAEVSAAQAKLQGAEAALHSAQAQGFRNPNEQQQLERAVKTAREALQALEQTLAPYQAVFAARAAQAPS